MKYWLNRILFLIKKNLLFEVLKSHFQHKKQHQFPMILPLISIDEIVGMDTKSFKVIKEEFEDGNISSFELECICKIVKNLNPKRVFEIGTYNGRTTVNIASNTSAESHIYTLDLPKDEMSNTMLRIKSGEKKFIYKSISGTYFIGTEYESKISQIYSDSAQFDYTELNNSMDFVFIDGSHSYEYVVSDTKIAMKLLRNGKGVILWHDYGWNEVIQALNELHNSDVRFKNLKNIKGTSFGYIKFD